MNTTLLTEEAVSVFSIDKAVRIVNLIVAQVGILINMFHLFMLFRKELRSTAIFTILRFICICDIFMLLTSFFDDFYKTMDFGKADYCIGYNSYSMKVVDIILMCINGCAIAISAWLTVLMALFRTLSIKYAMKSWSDSFSKKSVAVWVSVAIGIIPPVYISISSYYKYEITKKPDDEICYQYWNIIPNITEQYGLNTKDFEGKAILFSLFDGFLQLIPLITNIVLTVMLIKEIRKQKKLETALRVLRDKGTSTTGLIVVMLVTYLLSELPVIFMNFLVLYAVNVHSLAIMYLLPVASLGSTLKTLNSSTHCLVCFFMSSQYREVVKRRINFNNASVAVVEDVTVVPAEQRYAQ